MHRYLLLFKRFKERRTVYALITDADGNIAIILERGNMYNMIGGKIEDSEETKETLIREAREEIGYKLENVKYLESLACYQYFEYHRYFLEKYLENNKEIER